MYTEPNYLIDTFFHNVYSSVQKPDYLYHYTKQSSLEKILKSSELWLSNIRDMNDPQEVVYGIDVILRIMQNSNRFNTIKEIIETYKESGRFDIFQTYDKPAYVLSLSKSDDNIYSWINYGDDGQGVSIEFIRQKLIDESLASNQGISFSSPFIILFPVFYFDINDLNNSEINNKFMECLNEYFDDAEQLLNQSDNVNIIKPLIFESIVIIASLIKNIFHALEEEWRLLLITRGPGDLENIDTICTNKFKTIYRLKINDERNIETDMTLNNMRKVIESIRLGPKIHDKSIKNTIQITTYKKWAFNVLVKESNGILRKT